MLENIIEIICNYVDADPDEITKESALRKDIGMSSLDMINLAVEVEEQYGISLPNSEIININTVGELMDFIENNSK